MKLSQEIRREIQRHTSNFPNGDWKSSNKRFSELFSLSAPVLRKAGINPLKGGNEGRAAALERLGE